MRSFTTSMGIDLNAVMLAGLKNDTEALRDAVPGLVEYIRNLEERVKWLTEQRDAARNDYHAVMREVKDVTAEVMAAFPGSKLTGSTPK